MEEFPLRECADEWMGASRGGLGFLADGCERRNRLFSTVKPDERFRQANLGDMTRQWTRS
ncbi:MAG: hypothetical protein HQL91_05585 [Magnetococcales bacterium]|nr:hypothetical protein [Magnetococcales bacterium]